MGMCSEWSLRLDQEAHGCESVTRNDVTVVQLRFSLYSGKYQLCTNREVLELCSYMAVVFAGCSGSLLLGDGFTSSSCRSDKNQGMDDITNLACFVYSS